jgi:hypothetical protein
VAARYPINPGLPICAMQPEGGVANQRWGACRVADAGRFSAFQGRPAVGEQNLWMVHTLATFRRKIRRKGSHSLIFHLFVIVEHAPVRSA